MAFSLSEWRTMPLTAAAGISLWLLSWSWFLAYIYFLTQDYNWVYKLSIALVILLVFLLRAVNWARIIALMSSAMAVLFLLFLAFALFNSGNITGGGLVAGNLAAFCLSSYFLFVHGTADFFKKHSAPKTGEKQGKGPRDSSS